MLAVNSSGTALEYINPPESSNTVEVINDLATGGANKALSVEQGVNLKGFIDSIINIGNSDSLNGKFTATTLEGILLEILNRLDDNIVVGAIASSKEADVLTEGVLEK